MDDPLAFTVTRRFDASGRALGKHSTLDEAYVPAESRPSIVWTGCSYVGSYSAANRERHVELTLSTALDASGGARYERPFSIGASTQLVASSSSVLGSGAFDQALYQLALNGAPRDATKPLAYMPELSSHAFASNGTGWLLIGYRSPFAAPPSGALVTYRISESGQISEPNVLGAFAAEPKLAGNGTGYLSTWHTDTGISVLPLTSQGTAVGSPIRIATRGSWPDVVSGDSVYLVYWHDESMIRAQVVDAQGKSRGPVITVGTGEYPDTSYDGSAFVIVFGTRPPSDGLSWPHTARRITTRGRLTGAAVELG